MTDAKFNDRPFPKAVKRTVYREGLIEIWVCPSCLSQDYTLLFRWTKDGNGIRKCDDCGDYYTKE